MSPAAKNKIKSNIELGHSNTNFTTLNCPEESINMYDTGAESKWGGIFYHSCW